uniref:Cyclin-J-like protein n=1 Tax=Pseudonaja textilis TaxID=8673 RepID=A0A670YHL6_PSETE
MLLRQKCDFKYLELKLPVYKAHSPQIERRRYFAHLLTVLSSHCQLCPMARHLAVYLLDIFMDRYDVTVKQLYVVSIACLLLASKSPYLMMDMGLESISCVHLSLGKFEEKEDKVPKLELLNNFAYMCSLNLMLTKKDLLKMELLLLESFNWNLCLPTPAHYIDYYLFASVSAGDLHKGWPITSVTKFKAIMEKYSHLFLEASLQDHVFLSFRPSLVAAACVGASRVYLEMSPPWTTQLQLLTCYSWEHLVPCIELICQYSVMEQTIAVFGSKQQQQIMESLNLQTPTHVLFQQPQYHPLPQSSAVLSQFCSPIQDLCSAYRDSLQAPRSSGLSSGNSMLSTYSALQENFQPVLQTMSLQGPIAMQVAISTESRHCLSLVYGSSYFSRHHSYTAGCFDG